MRKKFEVIQGGGNIDGERERKFEKGEETVITTGCRILKDTLKAWLILPPGWGYADAVWLPKSKCILHTQAKNKDLHDVEVPGWLAKDKGLEC